MTDSGEPSETPSRRSNVELPTKRRRTLRSRGKTNQNVNEEVVTVDPPQVVEAEDRNNNQVEKDLIVTDESLPVSDKPENQVQDVDKKSLAGGDYGSYHLQLRDDDKTEQVGSPSTKEIDEKREIPPSKHEPTSTLYIKNFVRPFTVIMVRELLDRFGKVEFFWMNKIKSHCFVQYETVDSAAKARQTLWNVQWPHETVSMANGITINLLMVTALPVHN
ncbi:3252_t:CDS:2 [Paraglomus brasilianum]|uniref:3252_t:CDS:1 n=1 Tax=Paraglomus brasilianum TaxID=144538 RepID=A0A9N8WES0_9GLOM|nr:3252_t:CDS:2 [Paraglomus brasilianum]